VGESPIGRSRLTFRRLSGLDRSGPAPPETLAGAPLRPWTLPNFIGYVRLALIPVFLVVQLSSARGTSALGAVLFAVIGWSDYLDGMTARITGQYSRMGALLDPVVDRLLVISGVVVCWKFALLPRWALAVLAARELLMLVLARIALSRGVELKINWLGRWGVWPVFGALFFAMCGVHWLGLACLYVGLVLAVGASALYVRDGLRAASGQAST
jgi:CDP-diacylglycerol--glycerol-3-phosphate 3-phosphatidyltransferase